jgi:HSP20 family molecular chaperone IbpA
MIDYNEIFKKLDENLKHFNFGKDGEGWFGGINFKDGKWNGVDFADLTKKVSEILGYDVDLDKDDEKCKSNKEETKKENVCSEDTCKKEDCNCNSQATCSYYSRIKDDGTFILEALIPGETVDNFRISVNSKTMKLKIERKANTQNLPWYAAFKTAAEIDLPESIQFDSFKKNSTNGLLVVTAKIAVPENCEKEI